MKALYSILFIVYASPSFTQEWSLLYSHTSTVRHFAASEYLENIAIGDDFGLKLIYFDDSTFYSTVSYEFMNKQYSADLSNIKDMRISDNELIYVTTYDTSVLLFYNLDFIGGIPAYIIDGELSEQTYWSFFEMRSEFNWNGPLYGYFDIEDGDIYLECYYENCFEYPIHPYIFTYDHTSVFADGATLSLINYLNEEDQFLNEFDKKEMPFQEMKDAVIWNLVNYPQTEFRHKLHLWVSTDAGLGLYRSEENLFDYDEWNENSWELYNTSNSSLVSNNIDQLQRIIEDSWTHEALLMGHSSVPHSVFYFIDGDNDPAICPFDFSNSPLKSQIEISDIYSNFSESVFIAQGTKVYELDFADFQCTKIVGLNNISNSSVIHLSIVSPIRENIHLLYNTKAYNESITKIDIFNSMGVKIITTTMEDIEAIAIDNWSTGVYYFNVWDAYNILRVLRAVKI